MKQSICYSRSHDDAVKHDPCLAPAHIIIKPNRERKKRERTVAQHPK